MQKTVSTEHILADNIFGWELKIGLFHFLYIQGGSMMDEKIQGVPWLWFFPGVSISRYIYFPGGKSVQLVIFFRCGGLKIFFIYQFFPRDHKSTKIQFQGINKSTNRFCKDVYFFQKNVIIHTDTLDKKCIAHFLLWWRQIAN